MVQVQIEDERMEEHKKIEYWEQHFSKNTEVSLQYYTVDDGTKILGVYAKHEKEKDNRPVVLVAGWFSKISGWTDVTRRISEETSVFYIETREKKSSILSGKVEMSVNRMARDINQMRYLLPFDLKESILLCSSMGGSTMLEYLSNNYPAPHKTIMIGPNAEINAPILLTKVLTYTIPLFMINIMKKVIRWYLRNFLIDMEKEPQQYEKYCEVLNDIDPWKLKYSARECIDYKAWEKLDRIQADVILIGASADKMHKTEQTQQISEFISNAEYIDFSSNKATHSVKMAEFILNRVHE